MSKASLSTHSNRGFALTVALIMIVLAAILVLALLINASADRINADAVSKRSRAEMAAQSGLSAALISLVGTNGPTDFRYITTSGGNPPEPALIPLATPEPATGTVTAKTTEKRLLVSTGSTSATITLSGTTTPKTTCSAGYVTMSAPDKNGNSQETARYAFYVDEGGNRQNIGVQGSTDRVYAADPSELPLVTATAAPTPFTQQQLSDIKTQRALIFTPATANPIMTTQVAPVVDNYSYTAASAVTNLNPEGKPRVDLQKLKAYIDSLPVDQTSGNARAQLVTQLLNPDETGDSWGGGNLSILTKLPRYSGNQPKQIIANLIDYLDDDLIPTTNNVDQPLYFGVEGRAGTDGNVVGHPYINFVGTGLVFNRSNASGQQGGLNSTRVLVVLGIVNPWSKPTKDWSTFYVKPELQVMITGDASGGRLGNRAQDYFHSDFTTSDNLNQLSSSPTATIQPNTGWVFPSTASSNTNYANFYDILNTGGGRQPPGMTFSNLGFQITKLRLKFIDTDGRSGYVQVLDGLNTIPQPANPANVDLDHSGDPSSLIYKFTNGAPSKTDFHLARDPRLGFLAANWILSRSTENGTKPPTPATTIDIFTGRDANNFDFSTNAPSSTDHLWYTQTSITENFYVKSPPKKDSNTGTFPEPRFLSTGELGYLHTGIPWETLRLYVSGSEANGKERDRELLAYTHSGTFTPIDYGTVPTHAGSSAPTKPIPLAGGPLNVNTNKTPTLQSLFLGTTALADSDATARAKGGVDDPDVQILAKAVVDNANNANKTLFVYPGDFLALPKIQSVTNASGNNTDFKRETLARRTANVIGTHSTRFTVYALGEARDKAGNATATSSRVNLRAEVELQTDQNGRPVPRVLSSTYYLD